MTVSIEAGRKVCLITGGTEGVGKETSLELAKRGFAVVITARNENKARTVVDQIVKRTGNENLDYLIGDLASLESVRQLAAMFKASYSRLDVLINNAGVFLPRRVLTDEGFESSFQINYLSHFLLTQLLLPELNDSPQGRIINLSSSVHAIGNFETDNLQSEKKFSTLITYSTTKLLMLMFTMELSKRLSETRITANAVHPGIVRTNMMLMAPGALKIVSWLSLPFSVSPQKGARTSVYLATSPHVANVSGHYFTNSRQANAGNKTNTATNRDRLWNLSLEMVAKHIGRNGAK